MSSSILEKCAYIEETKQLLRSKIDPGGTKITDATPFREYAEYIIEKNVEPVNNTWNQWLSSEGNAIVDRSNAYYFSKTLLPFMPDTTSWEAQFKFYVNSNAPYYRTFFGSANRWWGAPSLELHSNGVLIARISIDGNQWSYEATIPDKIALNVWYWIRFGYTGAYYYISLSTDGENYEEIGRIDYSGAFFQNKSYAQLSIGGENNASDHFFAYNNSTKMDLRECYIKANEKIWWTLYYPQEIETNS